MSDTTTTSHRDERKLGLHQVYPDPADSSTATNLESVSLASKYYLA